MFGELRSMLQRPPSEALWEAVAALVLRAAREDAARAAREWWPYVEEHVARWGEVRRVAPEAWASAESAVVATLPWGLVTAVEVGPDAARAREWGMLREAGRLEGVREVTLVGARVRVEEIAAWLEREGSISALELVGPWGDEEALDRALELEGMSRIVTLTVRKQPLSSGALHLLAAAPLPALKAVQLVRAQLDDEGVQILSRAVWLGQLAHLALSFNRISDEAAAALVQHEALAGLGGLLIDHNALGDAAAAALATAPLAETLKVLALDHNRIGVRGAEAIAASAALGELAALTMHHNTLGAEGLLALVASPHLSDAIKAELRRVARVNASPYRVKSVTRMADAPEKQGRELRRLVPRGQGWAEARELSVRDEARAKPTLSAIKLAHEPD